MLYDLSLVWTPSTTQAQVESTLSMSAELGYNVVALDHVYHGAVPSTIADPFAEVEASLDNTKNTNNTNTNTNRPKLLHRATVVINDITTNYRLSAIAAVYDIVAVRPTTEKAFQAACINMSEPALISLDLTTYFPFYFKHRVCMAAVRRGLHFEVCYSHALRSGAKDAGRARALFVANLTGLIRATRGRGIVVSSGAVMGAGGGFELRGPADIVNLLAVWGLAPDRGTDAMSALPQSIVANEGLKRRGFRGAIDIIGAEKTPGQKPSQKGEAPKQGQGQGQKQKGNQNQNQTQNQNQKRKADDGLAVPKQQKKPRK